MEFCSSSDRKYTMLHYIAEVLQENYPQTLDELTCFKKLEMVSGCGIRWSLFFASLVNLDLLGASEKYFEYI